MADEHAEALRDVLEDRLVREGKSLCAGCDEPIHFNHDAGLWVGENGLHRCRGTLNDHTPR